VLGVVVAIVIWEVAAGILGPYRLPALGRVAMLFFPLLTKSEVLAFQGGGSQGYWPHLTHTIGFTLISSAMGVAVGVVFGLAMTRSKLIRGFTEVPIELLRTIPPLAAIPFILIWIGPGDLAQVMMVSYYAFVMMVVTTLNAASNVDPILSTFAATLGAGDNRIFRTVVFPAMLPTIVGGTRVAVGVAWSVQVVAELMGGRYGMGKVFSAMISFQGLDAIIVGMIWLAFAAAVVDAILVLFVRHLTRWAPSPSH
jgi:NitT/TauT family transport system permease protein/sulfonate transport system permease protein